MDDSVLVKEYFSQNLVQYRWLDDTRTKYVDRFFILVLAVLGARMQFASEFWKETAWLSLMYIGFCVVALCYARAIVFFRRQQQGHNHYIAAIVDVAMAHLQQSSKREASAIQEKYEIFQLYRSGAPVFLTKWVEFTVALIAVAAPLVAVADLWLLRFDAKRADAWIFIIGVAFSALVADATIRPWRDFNSEQGIDYSKKYNIFPIVLWQKAMNLKKTDVSKSGK